MAVTPRAAAAPRAVTVARLLMGCVYFVNGFNWWVKIITPYPSISDFAHVAPPPDVVGAMIQNGVLFHIVKATELLAGIALLTNRFVPLMLAAALPVTVPVFVVDMFFVRTVRGMVMGGGSLLLNAYLLLAYLRAYRPMLAARATPGVEGTSAEDDEGPVAPLLAQIARTVLPPLGFVACLVGAVMVAWLGFLIFSYALHPLPFWAAHPPRR